MSEVLNISDPMVRVSQIELEKNLSWLEKAIYSDHREDVETLQYETFLFGKTDRIPVLVSTRNDVAHLSPSNSDWPVYSFQQMWHDPAAMLLNELFPVYESVVLRDDKVFSIRPNLSQLFIPAYFGATGILAGTNPDDMPYINFVPSIDKIEQTLLDDVDIENSFMFQKFIGIVNAWTEILALYPKLSKYLHFALPDLQGPFNTYFLLRGVEAYIDFFDSPALMEQLMKKITEITADTIHCLADFLKRTDRGYCWNYGYPGLLRNVDDNSTQISKEQYLKFVHPWNVELTASCGGGIHHYCGDGKHIAEDIMSIPGIKGLNFGNPEMQDWEFMVKLSRKTETVLLWDKMISPGDLKKLPVGGLILKVIVPDIDTGKRYLMELGRG
jgi:hypothetical protein